MIHLDLYLEATDNEEDSDLHMQMRTALLGTQTTLKVINRSYHFVHVSYTASFFLHFVCTVWAN